MEHVRTEHQLQTIKVDHGVYQILPFSATKSLVQTQTATSPPTTPQESTNDITTQVSEQQCNHPGPKFAITDATTRGASMAPYYTTEPTSQPSPEETPGQPAQDDTDIQELLEDRIAQEVELMSDHLQFENVYERPMIFVLFDENG